MLPRPLLHNHFNITYRKIPVLTLGREAYIDTSLQTEALESSFPTHNSLYPPQTRPLTRLLTSFWTDRPLFRQTCGLMPSSVWASQFGTDRASLIGHPLDPAKLERKIPQMMSGLDLHLSLLESLLQESKGDWALSSGEKPSMLDISIFYQLNWGPGDREGQRGRRPHCGFCTRWRGARRGRTVQSLPSYIDMVRPLQDIFRCLTDERDAH